MTRFGTSNCAKIADFGQTYYDGTKVYYQIADYTGQASWLDCAKKAADAYKAYVLPTNGGVPGYWNFTAGLRADFERTGNLPSKTAVLQLALNGAYCSDGTPTGATVGADLSREVAHCLMAHLNAEALGAPKRARRDLLVSQALGHLDQWFGSRSFRAPSQFDLVPLCAGQYYYQPFMVAITIRALIQAFDATGDPAIPPAILNALGLLWLDAFQPAQQGMWYENCKPLPTDPWPAAAGECDLSLLIAPAYEWAYQRTGNVAYREKADALFAGGVGSGAGGCGLAGGYIDQPKQFNQSYLWSFDYVRWRSQ